MKDRTYIYKAIILVTMLISTVNINAVDFWSAPFDTTNSNSLSVDSILSLDDVLDLVANNNPAFKSFSYQVLAAKGNLEQAALWLNPEIEMEFEEVGWNSPGFKESEFTVVLAQEFEFFGQRSARKRIANAQIEATILQIRVSAFDLYLKTKERFYALAHAQQKVLLNQESVNLVKDIVQNIHHRINKGAALKSELLLANLEEQKIQLELDQSKQEVRALEATLASLWKSKPTNIKVSFESENEFALLFDKIIIMSNLVDSTREVIQKHSELKLLAAERNLAIAEARPTITLSGGVKRFEFDNSKSFLFGISIPIPFFNRNQGVRKSIDAQLQSMNYKIEQEKNEIQSHINAILIKLAQLKERHATLDTLLLPTAQDAYLTLKSAYDAGRIPYSQLLEANRILNDLSFDHNDIFLAIHEQINALESLTGSVIYIKRRNR